MHVSTRLLLQTLELWLAKIALHQSFQFGLLGMFAANVLGQMRLATMVCFEERQKFKLWACGYRCVNGWEQLERTIILVLYSIETVGWLFGCVDSLVRLTRWLTLVTVFSNRWGCGSTSTPWQMDMIGLRTWTAVHSGDTWFRPECTLSSLVRWGHWFFSAYGVSHRLGPLLTLYIGMLSGLCSFLYAWLSFLVGQAEGYK